MSNIAVTDTIDQAELEEMDARQRLAALKLLQTREDKLTERQKARKDYWRNLLTEKTVALHEAIDAAEPVTDAQCRKSLRVIKTARKDSEETKEAKAAELSDLKTAIKRIQETMTELIVKDPSNQMALDLGADAKAGVWLTPEVAEQVNLALSAKETKAADTGDEMPADLVALREQLSAMGLESITMQDEEDDEIEDGEEDGDDPDPDPEDAPESTDPEDGDEGQPVYEEDPTNEDEDSNVISLAGNQ
jgi:hypothetical protein